MFLGIKNISVFAENVQKSVLPRWLSFFGITLETYLSIWIHILVPIAKSMCWGCVAVQEEADINVLGFCWNTVVHNNWTDEDGTHCKPLM